TSAITLDLTLPAMDGWKLLDLLKHDRSLRHIPVEVISGSTDRHRALEMGAWGSLLKPVSAQELEDALAGLLLLVSRERHELLIVEDDEGEALAVSDLLSGEDVHVVV